MIRSRANHSRQQNILIVEDEAIVGADIQDHLQALDYKVVGVVGSAEDAKRLAASAKPDLVLMDIQLSGGADGISAAEFIRQHHGIPVVFLTAHGDDATLQRAKITEPFAYILKPFSERELRTAVETALYRHQVESEILLMERWLNTILDTMEDAIIATDKWGFINFLNHRAGEMTGWPEAEALNKPLDEVVHLQEASTGRPFSLSIGQFPLTRKIHVGDPGIVLVAADGKRLPVDYTLSPIVNGPDHCLGNVLVFRSAQAAASR